MASYSEKLRDPRWQRVRLEIMQRAHFRCERCGDNESPLNVHHIIYRSGAAPWEYPYSDLVCLCEECHRLEHLVIDDMRRLVRASHDPLQLLEEMTDYVERGQLAKPSHVAIQQLREFIKEPEDEEARIKRELSELEHRELSDEVREKSRSLLRQLSEVKQQKARAQQQA